MTVPMIKSIGDVPYPIDTHSDAFSPLLTAGAALGITGNGPADSAAWLQRVSTADGPTTVKSIHGRTLRWNQLNNNDSSSGTVSGVTRTNNSDGSVTIDGTATNDGYLAFETVSAIGGHKYLFKGCPAGGSATTYHMAFGGAYDDFGSGSIRTVSSSGTQYLRFYIKSGASFSNVKIWPQLFDLTAMFGAGSEPSTIEEFTALYPLPYYEYDAGSLLSVNMTGIETTGFNQWDEQWDIGSISTTTGAYGTGERFRSKNLIPVFPNTVYNAQFNRSSDDMRMYFYDENRAFISESGWVRKGTFTTPANAHYMAFLMAVGYGTTYNHDICINLSDPTRNGEYVPHWHQERPIPAGTLRGAGTVYDELTETERIVRVGERAYQSGDESDPTVITDGTVTHYPLTTPTTTPIDPPLNMTYRTAAGGTERVMVPTGENSAPPTLVTAQGYTAESLRDAALSAIAPIENGIASTNYGIGSYLIHGGQLCKVTTAIASGEAIAIGTNVTATTVMAEVIALIAQ